MMGDRTATATSRRVTGSWALSGRGAELGDERVLRERGAGADGWWEMDGEGEIEVGRQWSGRDETCGQRIAGAAAMTMKARPVCWLWRMEEATFFLGLRAGGFSACDDNGASTRMHSSRVARERCRQVDWSGTALGRLPGVSRVPSRGFWYSGRAPKVAQAMLVRRRSRGASCQG